MNNLIKEAASEAEKIIAEGEAEYMKILHSAYGNSSKAEFYSFVRALDAAKIAFEDDDVVYINKNSPLPRSLTKTS